MDGILEVAEAAGSQSMEDTHSVPSTPCLKEKKNVWFNTGNSRNGGRGITGSGAGEEQDRR